MANAHLKIGSTLLDGKYTIVAILGQGGFGITYLAEHNLLGRRLAIKEFFPKEYCDRDASTSHITLGTQSNLELVSKLRNKFIKEARNISRLNHPNIIKIVDVFEENNTAYYVMEYIDGLTLEQMVDTQGPLPVDQAARYMAEVASALEHIHDANMMHLDVKPANIMVRKTDNRPVLIDFGLSKVYSESGGQTSMSPNAVSHGYSPMEQYNADGVKSFSPPTDIYAFGATLYKILTGERPPESTKRMEQPLEFPPGFNPSVSKIINECMQLPKKKRPQTMAQVRDMIDILLRSLSGKGETVTVKTANRKKPLMVILGVLGVVAIALIVWLLSSRGDTAPSPDPAPIEDSAVEVMPEVIETTDTEPTADKEVKTDPAKEQPTKTQDEKPAESKKTDATKQPTKQTGNEKPEPVPTKSDQQSKLAAVKLAANSVSGANIEAGMNVTGATVSGNNLVFNVSCATHIYDADDCVASNPVFRHAMNSYMSMSPTAAAAARTAKQNGMGVRFQFHGTRSFSLSY